MSAAVAEPPAAPAVTPPPAGPFSPQEFVSGLSSEEKEAVFFALLAEARALGEDAGTLPIENLAGETVGYFLTPEAWDRLRELPPQTGDQKESSRLAMLDLDDVLTPDELTALLTGPAGSPAP